MAAAFPIERMPFPLPLKGSVGPGGYFAWGWGSVARPGGVRDMAD